MTDANLLQAYADHRSQPAFAELVNRHGGMVHATARRIAPDDADDVAQAVFLLLARQGSDLLRRHGNVAGWLHETARLCAANARRSRARRAAHTRAAAEVAVRNTHPSPADPSLLEHLDDGLGRLADSYRQVLLMRYMEDLSVDETAERLGLSPAAVMKRSTRGLAKLRAFFARRGMTSSVEGIAGCMVAQAAPLHEVARAALTAASTGKTTGPANALARRVSRPIGPVLVAAGGAACLVAAVTVIVRTASGPSVPGPTMPNPPAAVTNVQLAASPPIAPAVAGDPRQAADGFLAALRDRDVDRVAGYLPPGDDANRRAAARRYVAGFTDGMYARFPQRLTVQNSSVTNDPAGRAIAGAFDALPPIDADLGHAALRVEPAGGHWYVVDADWTDAEVRFAGAALSDMTAGGGGKPFDYSRAAKCWAKFGKDLPGVNPETLKEADIPGMVGQLGQLRTDLGDLVDALRGSDLEPVREDVARMDAAFAGVEAAARARGLAGVLGAVGRLKGDQPLSQAAGRIQALGARVNLRLDAQQEAHHADARPVAVEPDRQFVDESGATVTIPGPLTFPAWLRQTAAYKTWQTQHDIRTFTTRDDAGDIYTVSATGWVKLADGTTRELVNEVRMYRPDRTLAAVTNWVFAGDGPSSWTTLDLNGSRSVWRVEQTLRQPSGMSLVRVVHFDGDGNEHCYDFSSNGKVSFESTADPVGDNMRSVRNP